MNSGFGRYYYNENYISTCASCISNFRKENGIDKDKQVFITLAVM